MDRHLTKGSSLFIALSISDKQIAHNMAKSEITLLVEMFGIQTGKPGTHYVGSQ